MTTITNPYRFVNKTFTDTDGQTGNAKIALLVSFQHRFIWDKANLEGKVTVDDPMEAVSAHRLKMKRFSAWATLSLLAAHSGISDNEYTKNEKKMKVTKLLVSKVLMLLRQAFSLRISQMEMACFYAKYPGADDVNGLINGNLWLRLQIRDHLGIMDVKQFRYTDGKCKVVTSKAKLEKIDTKSDVADKDLINMAAHDHNGTINYVRMEVGDYSTNY